MKDKIAKALIITARDLLVLARKTPSGVRGLNLVTKDKGDGKTLFINAPALGQDIPYGNHRNPNYVWSDNQIDTIADLLKKHLSKFDWSKEEKIFETNMDDQYFDPQVRNGLGEVARSVKKMLRTASSRTGTASSRTAAAWQDIKGKPGRQRKSKPGGKGFAYRDKPKGRNTGKGTHHKNTLEQNDLPAGFRDDMSWAARELASAKTKKEVVTLLKKYTEQGKQNVKVMEEKVKLSKSRNDQAQKDNKWHQNAKDAKTKLDSDTRKLKQMTRRLRWINQIHKKI